MTQTQAPREALPTPSLLLCPRTSDHRRSAKLLLTHFSRTSKDQKASSPLPRRRESVLRRSLQCCAACENEFDVKFSQQESW